MENLELKESFEALTEASPEVFEFQKIEGFLKKIKNDFNLNEEELTNLDGILTFQILKKEQQNTFLEKIKTHLLLTKDENTTKKIVEKTLSFFEPEPEEKESAEETKDENSPIPSTPQPDVLSSLKERITVPTTIKPITTPVQQKPVEQQTKTTVDPYRELPQ